VPFEDDLPFNACFANESLIVNEFRYSFHNRSKFGLGIPDWVNDFFAHEKRWHRRLHFSGRG